VPALAYFQSLLGLPTTVFAFSLGDHIHAPNERFKVGLREGYAGLRWAALGCTRARAATRPLAACC
jgi:hypothetical protein